MTTSREDRLHDLFPALHLLRAARLAADPKKMLLGGVGLLVLMLGEQFLALLPFAPLETKAFESAIQAVEPPGIVTSVFAEGSIFERVRLDRAIGFLAVPLRSVLEPGLVIFRNNNSWSDVAWAWTRLIWALTVWSLFGGAICRMCVMQFAQKGRLSPIQALKFAMAQLQNFLVAPFLPLAGILILLACNAILGLLAALLPGVAAPVLAIVWGLVLFSGFLMAMMMVGLGTGWPLMIAAVSTEDSDGFDGLSRSFGFLTDRPAYAATLTLLAAPVFAFGWCLVSLLVALTFSLGQWAVQAGSPVSPSGLSYEDDGERVDALAGQHVVRDSSDWKQQPEPEPTLWSIDQFWIDLREPDGPTSSGLIWSDPHLAQSGAIARFSGNSGFSGRAILCWNSVLLLMLAGYGPSFFWSATTVGYFLLRQSDDGTPLDQVADYGQPDRSESPSDSEADSAQREGETATAE